jgi:hypothetical protein
VSAPDKEREMPRHTARYAALGLFTSLLPLATQAAAFTYITLSVPGQRSTEAAGTVNTLNDRDQVVGGVEDSNFNFQGFVWSDGEFTLYPAATTLAVIDNAGVAAGYTQADSGYLTIDTADGKIRTYNNHFDKNPFISRIYGIDAGGDVIVQDEYARNVTAGYVFTGPKKLLLLVAGSDVKYGGTFATAINDAETVTGSYFAGGQYEHGFVYRNDSFTSFDVPNALGGTFPYYIADDGTITGGYATAPSVPQIGFAFVCGRYLTINPPGATSSYVSAAGPSGELVGSYWNNTGGHGFIYRAGRYYTIDVPGGTYTTINAVNARGTLVGTYQDVSGTVLSFVAKCAPRRDCTR